MPEGTVLISNVQRQLNSHGYSVGPVDGIMGPRTTKAIRRYQADNEMAVTGRVDEALYRHLGGEFIKVRRTARVGVGSRPASERVITTERSGASPEQERRDAIACGAREGAGGRLEVSDGDRYVRCMKSKGYAETGAQPVGAPRGGVDNRGCGDHLYTQAVIQNVSDILVCDRTRAISYLSTFRKMKMRISRISLRSGKMIAQMYDQPSYVQNAQRRANRNFNWGDWFTMTQSGMYTISCIFDASRASAYRQGQDAVVSARLRDLSGQNATFDCR